MEKLRFDDFDNNFSAVLSSSINASDLTIYLSAVPTKATEGFLVLDADDPTKYEIIYFNAKGSNFVSCPSTGGRGQAGTSAQSHDANCAVKMYFLAEHFKAIRDAIFTGWFELNHVATYESATEITIPTDVTAIFTAGRKVKITFATSGVKYFKVVSSSYSNPNTTVVLSLETVLNEVIDSIEMNVSPQNFADDSFHAATEKTTPIDADEIGIWDSVSGLLNRLTWANLKATLKVWILGDSDFTYSSIYRQAIINGGMEIAQELGAGAVTFAKDTAAYVCDLFSTTLSGTAVNAGTGARISNASLGITGYAIKVAGATITGAGTIVHKYRIEAADAVKYKNKIASFSARVFQDTGGAINYIITIRKANAADNFAGGVTDISNSGNISVANSTATLIKFENVSLGDCSNGIEIEVKAVCGAVTSKNFYTTEWQFNQGAIALPFMYRTIGDELSKLHRYCFGITTVDVHEIIAMGPAYQTTSSYAYLKIPSMRISPALIATAGDYQLIDGVGAAVNVTSIALVGSYGGKEALIINCGVASGLTQYRTYFLKGDGSAGRILVLDARFPA